MLTIKHIKVLMLLKKNNVFCDYAEAILKSNLNIDEFISIRGKRGDCIDEELYNLKFDYIISFVSPWIIPQQLLENVQIAAINFHPGSPNYPGIGCYNFALYEGSKKYGVTCHHMQEKVDTGEIILTSYFDVAPFETVETLKLKSMNHLLYCFDKIISCIIFNKPLPVSEETWKRKPFTRKEMKELFEINPFKHTQDEIERRIRAASYPSNSGTYIKCEGYKFYLPFENRKPIID